MVEEWLFVLEIVVTGIIVLESLGVLDTFLYNLQPSPPPPNDTTHLNGRTD